ncbi:MAG: 5-methyltetrahydropteroyltriglutamate--homocysteine S-methyltransferase, partial [Acetanaerobacterium sp.]
GKGSLKILLQTYFGDIRDAYDEVVSLGFDGIGLDFVEGKQTRELIRTGGFPKDALLFAGVVNGKNIWRNSYKKALSILHELKGLVSPEHIVINTSCSLLHVPYTLEGEAVLDNKYKRHFAFAQEKLTELQALQSLFQNPSYAETSLYKENIALIQSKEDYADTSVRKKISALAEGDFIRLPTFSEREEIQKKALGLPVLPTTTIGSFPQTADVKALRTKLRKGEVTTGEYKERVRGKIAVCIAMQEDIGLDVLVHGEYERGDMVEYFGENLAGFLFTQNAWVQSYGTRCVKPPIIWSDIRRVKPITVEYSVYAQGLTKKPVKGMLTGPVTILNWSFPREDISNKEMAFQIALSLKEEVADLEAGGIRIIQIDEAALKEKLPLRRADWHCDYLDWAIPAFRLVHASVEPATQIHTHMCYSEFEDIITEIDDMDADVISFEAARSNHSIVDALVRVNFKTEVGPGVYDIHSPRVPGQEEIKNAITAAMERIDPKKLWVNPDCGLKTRGETETLASLLNLVKAAKSIRDTI